MRRIEVDGRAKFRLRFPEIVTLQRLVPGFDVCCNLIQDRSACGQLLRLRVIRRDSRRQIGGCHGCRDVQ